jgi:hypothetical protein
MSFHDLFFALILVSCFIFLVFFLYVVRVFFQDFDVPNFDTKVWNGERKILSTFPSHGWVLECRELLAFNGLKLGCKLRKAKSLFSLVLQLLELQGLSFPNFNIEPWKRFSPPCTQISLSLVLKFGNLRGFFLFMHQKGRRFQNYVPRFGFSNDFCSRSSKVWSQTLEG